MEDETSTQGNRWRLQGLCGSRRVPDARAQGRQKQLRFSHLGDVCCDKRWVARNWIRQAGTGIGIPAAGGEGVNGAPSDKMPSYLPSGGRLGSRNIPEAVGSPLA